MLLMMYSIATIEAYEKRLQEWCCNGFINVPGALETFTNIDRNVINGIKFATDNTVNGRLYFEPLFRQWFDFAKETGRLPDQVAHIFRGTKPVIPRTNTTFSILDQAYVESSISEKRALASIKSCYSVKNPRLLAENSGCAMDVNTPFSIPEHSGIQVFVLLKTSNIL